MMARYAQQIRFEIECISCETDGFADVPSRNYNDEAQGVARASNEYVEDRDELKTHQPIDLSVYVETPTPARGSSRIADKPTPRYKEARYRKPKKRPAEPIGIGKRGRSAVSADLSRRSHNLCHLRSEVM